MCFGHLNHCVDYCAGIRSVHGTAEQPVFSPHCERTDRILTEIIGKAAPPVFQIGFRYITPVENIIHGFIQPGIPDGLLLVKPRPESLQNRFFLLETQLFPLFIITGILFVNGVFHGKQPIAVLDSLYCRLAVVILLPFGNSVDKVSADMCPTGAAPDPRQTVITLIAVRFQISAVAFQKLLCMAAAPGRGIAIQDDLRKSVLTASEQRKRKILLRYS